jgi:pyrimidine deaminase RibD-like protein
MQLALDEAAKCTPTPSAFCVGAVLVDSRGRLLETGYSRELAGNTHAEANAIDKLMQKKGDGSDTLDAAARSQLLKGSDIYTTMEPCSVRLSGNVPCTRRILDAGISRVFLGTVEPDDFVKCEGVQQLKDAGVEVHTVPGFAEQCLDAARRGH